MVRCNLSQKFTYWLATAKGRGAAARLAHSTLLIRTQRRYFGQILANSHQPDVNIFFIFFYFFGWVPRTVRIVWGVFGHRSKSGCVSSWERGKGEVEKRWSRPVLTVPPLKSELKFSFTPFSIKVVVSQAIFGCRSMITRARCRYWIGRDGASAKVLLTCSQIVWLMVADH